MTTFGKTLRSCLPAIGLGLVGAIGMASVPAAYAQPKAKKEFVEAYSAAKTALAGGKYQDALSKIDSAWQHAEGTAQKSPLQQMRVQAYCQGLKQHQKCVESIDAAKSTGGLGADTVKSFDKLLAAEYDAMNQPAKALAQTKANVEKYGGTATELQYIARKELDAKNYGEAIKYAQKAVDAKGGGVAYNIMLNAYSAQNKMDDYYKLLERIAPVMKQDTYWRPYIERAKKEPKFKSQDGLLDVYRTLDAAGVKLNPTEVKEMADMALNRGNAIEAEKIWAPLFKNGTLGGPNDKDADRNKRLYQRAQDDAKADKAGELAASETAAATKTTGDAYASTAEAWLGAGDYAKAIGLYQKALDKGQMDPGVTDLVRLRMGIAQYKGGKKADAVKTWQSIKADNGAAWLAKAWIGISKG
ncbi:MAG: bacterial transcriptional activator domain-containing protein [Hyphomonadaceae bacterium]